MVVAAAFGATWLLWKAGAVPISWALTAGVILIGATVLLAGMVLLPKKRILRVRNWHAGHIAGVWGFGGLGVTAAVIVLEAQFGSGRSPEMALLVMVIAMLMSVIMVAVTAVWATGHPHASWHPLKLLLLWFLVGLVSVLWYAARYEDAILVMMFFLVVPLWIAMIIVTWTWLSARE